MKSFARCFVMLFLFSHIFVMGCGKEESIKDIPAEEDPALMDDTVEVEE